MRSFSRRSRSGDAVDPSAARGHTGRMFPIRDHNPSGRTPYVNNTLIAVNVAVFLICWVALWDPGAQREFYARWALVPALATRDGAWTGLATSMFLHAGFMHLAGNMLFLWIFGDNLEDRLGHAVYLAFYLACGAAGGLAHVLAAPGSPVPTIGASGAIAGVMGGYLLLYPKARVDVLVVFVVIGIFTVPAWAMLGLWFAIQLFQGAATDPSGSGVAYWAHAGGFAAGAALILPLLAKLGGAGFWSRTEGHPPHPEAVYARTRIPRAGGRR